MEWVDVASKLGVPVAILAAMLYGIYKSGKFLAEKIAVPLFERQVHFMDTTAACLSQQTETCSLIRSNLQDIAKKQDEHFKICSVGQSKTTAS